MKQTLRNFCYISICFCLLYVGLQCYQPASSKNQTTQFFHTISRLSFGIAPQQIATIQQQDLETYIQTQLNPSFIEESSRLTNQLAQLETIDQKSIALFKTFQQYNFQLQEKKAASLTPKTKQQIQHKRNQHKSTIIRQARQAHLVQAIASQRQLQEVMTNFWLDHFNVYAPKKVVAFWLADYENDLRLHAFDNFREILGVTAHHPAMLIYLDNNTNIDPNREQTRGQVKGINENYARELMELHTLGVDGGYTQQDVTNLAKIFTGWGVDLTGDRGDENNFRFFSRLHDFTEKVFLGHQIAEGGIEQGEQALNILANHPATARLISYKLAQYFVTDHPPEILVERLTQTFLESQGNIKTILNVLFHSSEFSDPNYYNTKFKTPFQYLVSLVRASEIENPNLQKMEWMLSQLAMPIFGCEAPNGYQNTESAWLNPDAMLLRVSYATSIARGVISDRKPVDYKILQTTLDSSLSEQTRQTVADSHPNLKAALILGSPEMMYR